MTWTYETEHSGGDGDRLAHNPEVAGSNPVPATRGNGPRGILRGPFSCLLGTLLRTLASLMICVGNKLGTSADPGSEPLGHAASRLPASVTRADIRLHALSGGSLAAGKSSSP